MTLPITDPFTSDPSEIETQKAQFQRIIEDSERPDSRLVLAIPEIESWLGKTDFKRDRIRNFNKISEELYFLQNELSKRAATIPSLNEFIEALKSFDAIINP